MKEDFLERDGVSSRPITGGLDTTATQKKLGIEFHNIEEALKEFIQDLPVN